MRITERDGEFQRKQKDARMPARDSHKEERMTPRQGGQDFDLRRARDAPSPGASRSHRQAVPLPMEADPLQATPEVTQQAKTYGSEPVAGNNNGYITAQEFSSQDTSGRMPFSEDALRIMRAVRFSAQLGYQIEEKTKAAIEELAPTLKKISAERIQVELVKLLMSPHPDYLRVAYEAGITAEFLPEFDACMTTSQNTPHHCYTVGEHILHSLCHVRADKVLRITMLLHDIGKPVVRKTDENGRDHFKMHGIAGEKMAAQILRRLKFDNDTIRKVTRLVKWHDDRPEGMTKAVRRAVNRIGEELFPYYLEVQQADMLAQSDYRRAEKQERLDKVKEAYETIINEHQCVSLKTLAVTGKDLIEAGYKPGREIGETLNRLLEVVLADPQKNQKEILLGMLDEK